MQNLNGTVQSGAATGAVRTWLRLEGAAVFLFAVWLYAQGDHSWILFAALFLSPDLAFLGYLAGARIGAVTYNALHSHVGPLALAGALLLTGHSVMLALIWSAHIGFDRLIGYGLKYPTDFKDTHLGRIGQAKPQ